MNWSELPNIDEVFRKLRVGRHISVDDGRVYKALADHEEEYREMFKALGFSLERHNRDFFYFRADSRYSSIGSRVAVFFFILVEWVADRGEPIRETILTQSFALSDLPHFDRKRYRAYMSEAGIENEDSLRVLLRHMERMGFLRREGEQAIRFRTPAYRLLDLCAEMLEESSETTS